jgi:glycosyltransferase involved in cell wall biosynthesis
MDVAWVRDGAAFGWPGALPRLRQRPWRAVGVGRFIVGARRALAERGPFDRVIAHWVVPCAWPVATSVTAPLEVVAHGSDVRLLLRAPSVVRQRLMGALLDHGAAFRFASRELHAALLEHDERLMTRGRVELPALALDDAPAREAARHELSVDPGLRLVVIASRLVREKRVDVALGALSLLPRARVVVLGDGPERRGLQRRFPSAELLGALPRPRALAWLAAADLVVSASREEGAPSVVREARALGVPVVTTRAGDLSEWALSDPDLFVLG